MPSSRHRLAASYAGFPNPTPSIHSVSHARDAFATCFVGLFHPTTAFRVRSTGSDLQHSRFTSSVNRALSSLDDQALQPCGCATLSRPTLRALIRAGVQDRGAGFSCDVTQSPHELFLLQVFALNVPISPSQDPPLVRLLVGRDRFASLQRPNTELGWSLSRLPTCPRFLTCLPTAFHRRESACREWLTRSLASSLRPT